MKALLVTMLMVGTAFAQPTPVTPVQPPGTPQNVPQITSECQGRPIERVQFRGNRKVEDDAIRIQLVSKAGSLCDAAK
ncbi:MAG TPA: hypothetical protein VLB44_22845, partial [Kofleriaceae bacterium]|nr:hypothetical protein [Kofleriaceae bacterium]